jgi:hypothetical protein
VFVTGVHAVVAGLRGLVGVREGIPVAALVRDARNFGGVILLCEAFAAGGVAVLWGVGRGVEWWLDVRELYKGWYEEGGIYD